MTTNSENNVTDYPKIDPKELDVADFYLNHFDEIPIGRLSAKLLKEGEHAFFGISPFNGYFSYEKIRLMIKWARRNFKSFTFFYPDTLAAHTLAITKLDYTDQKIAETVKEQDKRSKNKIIKALKSLDYKDSEIANIFMTFSDIKDNPAYLKSLENIQENFHKNKKIKSFCYKLVDSILRNHDLDWTHFNQEKIDYAAQYLMKEAAIAINIPTLCGVKNSVHVYHDIFMIYIINEFNMALEVESEQGDLNEHDSLGHVCLNIKSLDHFLNQIINNIDTNIFIKSKDLKYMFMNNKGLGVTQSSLSEILGKRDLECPWGDFDGKLRRIDQEVIFNGLDFEGEEIGVIDGREAFFKVSKKPFKSESGEVIGLIGASMDITDIKMAQIKAEQEKQSKQFFISAMSHEMNNYVQSIRNASKFLAENSTDKTTKELAEIINYSSCKLTGLRENLYDFSKVLHSGEVLLKKEKVDVNDLIRKEIQVYNGMGVEILNGNKIILISDESKSYETFIDQYKIIQVIINLLNNSVKACRDNDIRVNVGCFEKDQNNYMLISVQDEGPGIPLPKESIFSFDKIRNTSKGGLGIGLPVCMSIIKAHGGDMEVETSSEGTLIICYIPIKESI